ncbi:MAG: D-tyrosyl-tRNA(Tyr) deacylase [Phycisphaeraceae bacterium]|nr:D-tyrosyl-tRNA(Tyr) deacylase [Phycisphaeraceae bacterium]
MRCVVQRVLGASVEVGGEVRAEIARGLVVLAGLEETDVDCDLEWAAEKIAELRIFEDPQGKMNLSVKDIGAAEGGLGAGILMVPNFTVAGDARKGRRPSFDKAMRPERAEGEFSVLVELVRSRISAAGVDVQQGVFRADMKVSLINDGPVTIVLESPRLG